MAAFLILLGLLPLFHSCVAAANCTEVNRCRTEALDSDILRGNCSAVVTFLECVNRNKTQCSTISETKTTFAQLKTTVNDVCSDMTAADVPFEPQNCTAYQSCMDLMSLSSIVTDAPDKSVEWCGYLENMVECQIQFGDLCWGKEDYQKRREALEKMRGERIEPVCGKNPKAGRCLRNGMCSEGITAPNSNKAKDCNFQRTMLQCLNDNRHVCPVDESAATFPQLIKTITSVCNDMKQAGLEYEPENCENYETCMSKIVDTHITEKWQRAEVFAKSESWCKYFKQNIDCQVENPLPCLGSDWENKQDKLRSIKSERIAPVCGGCSQTTAQLLMLMWISLLAVFFTRT